MIKYITIFKSKRAIFGPFSCKKLYQLSHNWSNLPKQDWIIVSQLPSIKCAWRYPPWISRNEFSMKSATEFPTLHHLSSKCDILTIVTLNWAKLGPMETRNLDLPRNTKFEEIQAMKGLQRARRMRVAPGIIASAHQDVSHLPLLFPYKYLPLPPPPLGISNLQTPKKFFRLRNTFSLSLFFYFFCLYS